MAQIKKLSTELQPLDKLLDTSGDSGTSGQVLSSTGSGINWINGGGTITGSGNQNYIPLWSSGTVLTNSIISSSGGDITINGSDNDPRIYINPLGGDIGDTALIQFNSRGIVGYTGGLIELGDNGQSKDVRLRVNTADLIFQTSNTTRMTVKTDGKVGIGTTDPEVKLTIKGDPGNTNQPSKITNNATDTHTGLFLNGTGNAVGEKYGMQFGNYNEYSIGGIFGVMDSTSASTSGDLTIDMTDGTTANALIERVRFTHEGNVGIGTVTPDSKLSVTSTSTASEDILYLKSGIDNADEYLGLAFEVGGGGNGPHGAIRVYNGPSSSDTYMSLLTTTNGGTLTQGLTQNHLGDVGIGTNIPLSLSSNTQSLTINSTRTDLTGGLFFRANSSSKAQFYWDSTGLISDIISGSARWVTGSSERMRITSTGDVGIGISSPAYKLDVAGTMRVKDGNSAVAINEYSNGATIWLDGSNGDFSGGDYFNISAYGTTDLAFGYAAGTKMTLKNTGLLGIGTTAPNEALEVSGNIRASGSYKVGATDVITSGRRFYAADGSNSAPAYSFSGRTDTGMWVDDDGSNDRLRFTVDGTNRFYIDNNGITSVNTVYVGTAGTFRNYSGVWKATTGQSGNGFQFYNTADNSSAVLLSITSDASAATASVATFSGKVVSAQTASSDGNGVLTTKSYVDGLVTGVTRYMGLWDASSGTGGSPDLTASTYKVPGYYFIVSVAGSATPNGAGTEPNTWHVGDWVIWSDQATDAWQKIDNTSVLSGTGTANKVAMWNGDESLTNAPITISTNDATFAGNVGIGGTPSAPLHIAGTSGSVGGQSILFNGNTAIWQQSDATLTIRPSGTDAATFSSTSTTFAGNVNLSTGKSVYISGTSGLRLLHDGTDGHVISGTGDLKITNGAQDKDIIFRGNDGGSSFTALTLDMSEGGNATFAGDVTINGSHLVLANGTTEAQATDYLYIGGNGLSSADAAIYIGNGGSGDNVGWRLYYEGSGSGNDNKFIIKSENTGSPVDALAFTQDGNATFAGNVTLNSRLTFDYGGDHYLEAGTNSLAYKDSTGGSVMSLNASTSAATFAGTLTIPSYIYHTSDPSDDTYFGFSANDTFVVYTAGGKGIEVDSNRNVAFTGDITVGANYIGRDSHNRVDFQTDDSIIIRVADTYRGRWDSTGLNPYADSTSDLGQTGKRWANLWVDSINGATPTTGGPYLPLAGGTLTSSGNVPLYVTSSGSVSYIQIQNSSTGTSGTSDGLTIGNNGTAAYIWNREQANLLLGTNDTTAVTIDSSQDVTFAGTIDVNGAVSTFGPAGTGTDDAVVSIDGGSGTGGEAYLRLTRGGTSGFILNHAASSLQVRATANIPMYFYTNDTLALTLDTSQNATFANSVTVGHDLKMPTNGEIDWNAGEVKLIGTADDIKLQGGSLSITGDGSNATTLTESGTGDFTIDAVGDIKFDADGGDWYFKDGGTNILQLTAGGSSSPTFSASQLNADIIFKGNDGGSTITALTLDISEAGTATFNNDVIIEGQLQFNSNDGVTCSKVDWLTYLCPDTGTSVNSKIGYLETNFPDNSKVTFGNASGGDLEIYHDGSNSYVKDSGTGNLWIQGSTQVNIGGANGEIGVQYVENSGVGLRHNNVQKLSTTSTGIQVEGNIILSGNESSIILDHTLSSNGESGILTTIGTGMFSTGDVMYLASGGGWSQAAATSAAGATSMLSVAGAGSPSGGMVLQGIIYMASHGFTIGAPLYLSTTGGDFTNTAPSSSGQYVRILGYAIDANHIYFDPDKTWVLIG